MADAIRTNGDVHQDGAGSHVNGDPPIAARYPSKGDELETAVTPYFDAGPVDSSAVRFINGSKEDEARTDADGVVLDAAAYVGLRKEELAKYAVDPYWVRLRIILLVVVAITWLAMLVAAIFIIVFAPKCPPRPDQDWWQTAVVYHVHPQSFKDSNNDGSGDIKGILSKLSYLTGDKGLKVSAINIGPMYPSPHLDFGYDVTNYQAICGGHYGTLAEFDELRGSIHKTGLKLILDFVPNHTSRRHKWFQQSRNSTLANSSAYRDYYIWQDGRLSLNGSEERVPPNDWTDVYGGSAWEWDEVRKQYYYHTYSVSEPDLNLRSEAVINELDDALKFWLSRGVDGFRMVGVQYLYEPASLTDKLERFQREGYELIVHWRQVIDDNKKNSGKSKSQSYPSVLIVDVIGSASQTALFTRYNDTAGAHIATNKALLSLNLNCNAQCILDLINNWTAVADTSLAWSNWQVGSVDTERVLTRYGNDTRYVNAINMLLLTLPGTAMLYYGDELGMEDVPSSGNVTTAWRAQLSPMQWDGSANAGFTESAKGPWMPVADNYIDCNVETEGAHGSGKQHVNAVRKLVALRRRESMQWGTFHPTVVGNVLIYVRQAEGFDPILIAINFGPTSTTVNFESAFQRDEKLTLPEEGKVVTSTYNFDRSDRLDAYKDERIIKLEKIYLKPTEGIVLTWKPVPAGLI